MKTASIPWVFFVLLFTFSFTPVVLQAQTDRADPISQSVPSSDVGRGVTQGDSYALNPPLVTYKPEVADLIEEVNETLVLEYLEGIVSFGPRVTTKTACFEAAQYIHDGFVDMGLDVRFHEWANASYWGKNVEATIHDSSGTNDEVIIVCGHHDSVWGSPGADDNGSGSAAALSVAHVVSNYTFDCEIRFITFDGEEQGLMGSHQYVAEVLANGDNIIAVLNADMIGYAITQEDMNNIKIHHNLDSAWLKNLTVDVAETYYNEIDLVANPAGNVYGSDHNSFYGKGYDGLFYHERHFNDYYHSSNDTIQHMNITYYAKGVKLILATLVELAGDFEPKSLLADDYTLSSNSGGMVNLYLDADVAHANRNFVVMGSVTGIEPGFPFPGGYILMPLNWDIFTVLVVQNMGSPSFVNFMGTLDGNGHGLATFNTLGPLPSSLIDSAFSFAYACGKPWDYVSNPVSVKVVE